MRFSTVLSLLAVGTCAAAGVAALATGWVAPWLRRGTVRPTLYGAGTLVFASGMATGVSMQFFTAPAAVEDALMVVMLTLVVVGGVMQTRSQRAGRTCTGPATKNAS